MDLADAIAQAEADSKDSRPGPRCHLSRLAATLPADDWEALRRSVGNRNIQPRVLSDMLRSANVLVSYHQIQHHRLGKCIGCTAAGIVYG